MKKILVTLIATLLLCGCDGLNEYRDSALRNQILTSEEFLRIVSENEEALGLTVDDFADFDVDDFIVNNSITETRMGYFIDDSDYFLRHYKMYSRQILGEKINRYRPQELLSIDSTVEEFEIFKEKYFERIGSVQLTSETDSGQGFSGQRRATIDGLTEGYTCENEEDGVFTFVIGQTKHIDQLNEDYWHWDFRGMYIDQIDEDYWQWEFREMPIPVYYVYIYFGDGTGVGADFFISNNGKFFAAFTSRLQSVYPVQTFCEMDG